MPVNSHLAALRDAVNANVPPAAGVYMWKGSRGEALYIGKSRNLRRRMLSYLRDGAVANGNRQRHLVYAIRGFEHREVPGELLALLLEDALIKQLEPRHNTRQRDYRERCYLHVTSAAAMRCLEWGRTPPADGPVYGPFKDRHFVRGLIEMITVARAIGAIQRFERRTPGAVGASRDAAPIRAFLAGDESWISNVLSGEMERASQVMDYERAAGLRESVAFVSRFAQRQRFLDRWRTGTVHVTEGQSGLAYTFVRGQLIEVIHSQGWSIPVPPELADPLTDELWELDRANIVYDSSRRHLCDMAPPP